MREWHKDAIKCFADNVRSLLMTKPYYGHKVLSIDPGYRAGCKIAVVNEQGVVRDYHDMANSPGHTSKTTTY